MIQKFRRSKKVYEEFVCPHCFYPVNKCRCDHYPPGYLIQIDREIQEVICILNSKGYRTRYCCASHVEEYRQYQFSEIYICMAEWLDIPEIPEGFIRDKGRDKNTIRYHYPKKLTEEAFSSMKKQQLDRLLDWCNHLPQARDTRRNHAQYAANA